MYLYVFTYCLYNVINDVVLLFRVFSKLVCCSNIHVILKVILKIKMFISIQKLRKRINLFDINKINKEMV